MNMSFLTAERELSSRIASSIRSIVSSDKLKRIETIRIIRAILVSFLAMLSFLTIGEHGN